MGKYFVFLLFVIVSCVSHKNTPEGTLEAHDKRTKKYNKLNVKALNARQNYLDKINKKAKGGALRRAKEKMDRAEARVEKQKINMRPTTKDIHRTY